MFNYYHSNRHRGEKFKKIICACHLNYVNPLCTGLFEGVELPGVGGGGGSIMLETRYKHYVWYTVSLLENKNILKNTLKC